MQSYMRHRAKMSETSTELRAYIQKYSSAKQNYVLRETNRLTIVSIRSFANLCIICTVPHITTNCHNHDWWCLSIFRHPTHSKHRLIINSEIKSPKHRSVCKYPVIPAKTAIYTIWWCPSKIRAIIQSFPSSSVKFCVLFCANLNYVRS